MDPSANQNTELFLKNLCINGCSITSSTGDFDTANPKISGSYPEINRECRILILPEVESKVMPFELTVELCWSCIHDGIYEAGGLISGYPEGEQYQSFADYLAWQVAYT
jgi:hypothetical protein